MKSSFVVKGIIAIFVKIDIVVAIIMIVAHLIQSTVVHSNAKNALKETIIAFIAIKTEKIV